MKVLVVCAFFPPKFGGVETHVFETCKVLWKKGRDVTVLTRDYEGQRLPEKYEKHVLRMPEEFRGVLALPKIWRFIKENVCVEDYDVIHCHDFSTTLWLWEYVKLPIVTTFHGYESDPVKLRYKVLHKLAENDSKEVFVVGDYLRKEYGTRCSDENVLVGGMDTKGVKKCRKYKNRILFLGRLDWDTNIREYVKAMEYLPDYQLDIYGEGPFAKEIGERSADLQNISCKGPYFGKSRNLVRKYKYVFSSRYLTSIEAMANGSIVFAIGTTPLMSEVLYSLKAPKECFKVCDDVDDVVDLFRANWLFSEKKANVARRFGKGLDWSKIMDKYEKAYERVKRK